MNEKKIQQIRARHERIETTDDGTPVEIEKLYTDLDKAQRHIELLQNKVDMEKSCACAYDTPDDVCLPHSPLLAAAQAKIEDLTRERNEARREVERLREKLIEISQYETSAPAGFEWDIVVEEIVEIAREAVKA